MDKEAVLALAGLCQAAILVDKVAYGKPTCAQSLSSLIDSLYQLDAPDTLSVYGGDVANMKAGLRGLISMLDAKKRKQFRSPLHYSLGLLHLSQKLLRTKSMREEVYSRLKSSQRQRQYFSPLHTQMLANLGDIYLTTFSKLRFRIQVQGKPTVLHSPENSAKIRALLLAGIRSAVLWNQLGGKQWHLLLKKREITRIAQEYLALAEKTEEELV